MKDQNSRVPKDVTGGVRRKLQGLVVSGFRALSILVPGALKDHIRMRIEATIQHADEAIASVNAEIAEAEHNRR
jgi:hypothetical protein